jgi:hypothetical protein
MSATFYDWLNYEQTNPVREVPRSSRNAFHDGKPRVSWCLRWVAPKILSYRAPSPVWITAIRGDYISGDMYAELMG